LPRVRANLLFDAKVLAGSCNGVAEEVGAGVFAYRFQRTTDDPYGSACLMTFFGRVSFLCMTVAKALAAKQKYQFNLNPIISCEHIFKMSCQAVRQEAHFRWTTSELFRTDAGTGRIPGTYQDAKSFSSQKGTYQDAKSFSSQNGQSRERVLELANANAIRVQYLP
jgi:hypothetical protein